MSTGNPRARALPRLNVHIVSRCSWTLFNFRRRLIHSVAERGARVVALGACDDGFDEKLRGEGIDVRHVPVSRKGIGPLADLRLLWVLRRIFSAERPDVVHAFTIKPSIYGTLAAALARIPVRVVTITGLGYAFTSANRFLRAIVEMMYRVALARAHLVFFQNAEDQELFLRRRLVEPSRTRLIAGSGVDLEAFRVQSLPSESGKAPSFLMIARLLKEKGVREYVEAASALKKRYPAVTFRLLGGADPRNPTSLSDAELREIRRSQAVEWHDEVDDVRPFIAQADAIVLPSYREGLPRTLLEGAAMGRALVAADVPGCREIVTDGVNGWLSKAGDAASLAEALEKLIARPSDLAAFGARARELIEAKYDERVVIEQTLAAYAELIERHGSKAGS